MRVKTKHILLAVSLIVAGAASARILDYLIKSHSEAVVKQILEERQNSNPDIEITDQVATKLAAKIEVNEKESISTEELVEEILNAEDLTDIQCRGNRIAITKANIQGYRINTYFSYERHSTLDKVRIQLNDKDICEFKNINNRFISKRLSSRVSECEFSYGPDVERLNECCSRGKECIDLVNEWL